VGVSRAEALPQLAMLGIITGLISGGVIIAFRLVIELSQGAFLPGGDPENYEGLTTTTRFLLPLGGGLLLGLLFQFLPARRRQVGVVHVMERLYYHQGRMPFRNALVQFIGGAVSIITGQSVGREGPAIHLGAASGSLPGQYGGLPNNSLRVLTSCGVAAAIAAMFNTPLAGVIFAMEVVMMEYTVVGFAPVILAAVSATALSELMYGSHPAFQLPPVSLGSLIELPYILLIGLVIGGLSTAFIFLVRETAARLGFLPIWVRMTLAGLVVGLLAIPAPQIMSIGYDTVNAALIGELAFGVLVLVMVCKIVATAGCVGLGIPGGMIGPVVFVGALAGGALGMIGQTIAPTETSSSGLYALLGMGAMMAGTLQAPLAALTAILELTGNPHVIMPGMLAVIAATITARAVFRQPSVYHALLRARGLDVRNDPVLQSLRRTGVGAVMNKGFVTLERRVGREAAQHALEGNPEWILVKEEGAYKALLLAVALAHALTEDKDAAEFDLYAIPGERLQVASIDLQANLQEALDRLNASSVEALYVSRLVAPGIAHVYGVLTRERIERSYRYS
jgi:CIC family chloride channel protein